MYRGYTRIARQLAEAVRSIPPSEAPRVAEVLRRGDRLDLAAVYAAGFQRLLSTLLEWEEHCPGRPDRRSREPCRSIERFLDEVARDVGVAAYFNLEIKRLLTRLHMDFSPVAAAPRWMLTFASRYGMDLAGALTSLDPVEQVVRVPYYLALMGVVDGFARRMVDLYSQRESDVAAAMASYVYYEVVEPLSSIALPLEVLLEVEAARSRGGLEEAYRVYADAVVRLLYRSMGLDASEVGGGEAEGVRRGRGEAEARG